MTSIAAANPFAINTANSGAYALRSVPQSATYQNDTDTPGLIGAAQSSESITRQIQAHPGLAEAFRAQGVDTASITALEVTPSHVVYFVD
ncbi:hypothetical protein [Consotaella salsifontis]|nr:hypothetical protein [Consotaella salsifontis]